MDIPEFLAATGMSLHELSQRAQISYPTLHRHHTRKGRMSVDTAMKLEAFDSRMNAAEILGLEPAAHSKPTKGAA